MSDPKLEALEERIRALGARITLSFSGKRWKATVTAHAGRRFYANSRTFAGAFEGALRKAETPGS